MIAFLVETVVSSAESTSNGTFAAIIVAALAMVGTVVTAVISSRAHIQAKIGAEQATQANEAVNHRKPGQDRLFDMVVDMHSQVREIKAFQQQWADLPASLDDAEKVVAQFKVIDDRIISTADQVSRRLSRLDADNTIFHHKTDERLDSVESKVDGVAAGLAAHNEWEAGTKWPSIEQLITSKETP